jgi:AraC-like DNA-binding protein
LEIRAKYALRVTDGSPPATRGVLRTPPPDAFELRRWDPSPALVPYAHWHWAVRWDLRGREPHRQVTVGHPSAHLVVEDDGAWLYGPQHERFERVLRDRGRAVGTRFRAGGLRPLLGRPLATITDERLPAAELPGLDAGALARDVHAEADLEAAAAVLDAALVALLPAEVPTAVALADRAVALLDEDRSLVRAADLAARLGVSVRSLQRLFADAVGVGPAWVVRRHRLQDAAARAVDGGDVDWAALARELGYYDQAHLVREFTAVIGTPPARYAAAG